MIKGVNAFSGFSVNNLEKAKKFYNKTLGLKVSQEGEVLWLHIGKSKVVMYPKENHTPATFTILNFPVPNLEAAMNELRRHNVRFEQYNLPGIKTDKNGIAKGPGLRLAWFKDPAGNIISVLEKQKAKKATKSKMKVMKGKKLTKS